MIVCLLHPLIPFARNTRASASSVSLFPRLRMRDITSERLDLEKTSAIDTDFTNYHRSNPCESVQSVSHLRPLRLGEHVSHFVLTADQHGWTQIQLPQRSTEGAKIWTAVAIPTRRSDAAWGWRRATGQFPYSKRAVFRQGSSSAFNPLGDFPRISPRASDGRDTIPFGSAARTDSALAWLVPGM